MNGLETDANHRRKRIPDCHAPARLSARPRSPDGSGPERIMARQKRDYRADYQRRIARGLSKGLTRSQARGHPKPAEQYVAPHRAASRKLEAGVAALRKSKNLTAAARQAKVAP